MGSNGKAEFEKAVIEEIGKNCEIHSKLCTSLSIIDVCKIECSILVVSLVHSSILPTRKTYDLNTTTK